MPHSLTVLDHVRVARPCPMRWEDMNPLGPGDRVRRCGRCELNVYNLSNMTRAQAEALLASREPGRRLCAGFYRRADGTILTRDCPVGLRAARARAARLVARLAAAAALLLTGAVLARSRERDRWAGSIAQLRPFADLCQWIQGRPSPPPAPPAWIAGEICPLPVAGTR